MSDKMIKREIEMIENEIVADKYITEIKKNNFINEIKNKSDYLTVTLPNRLSVSTLLYLAKEPEELAIRIRRPMPNHVDKYARQGTEFHLWLENHFKHPALISMDDLFNQSSTKLEKEND